MVSGKEPTLFGDFLFPKIFETFRMSIQPTKLIITSLALAVICLAGWLMDFNKTVVTKSEGLTELQIYLLSPDTFKIFIEKNVQPEDERIGVFSTLWHFSSEKFHGAVKSVIDLNITGVVENIIDFFRAMVWAILYHFIYCIIYFAIILAVISVAGGAVCRITALQFAKGEKPGLTEALRFSTKRFVSFFTAPLAPVCIIIFIGIFILLLGLTGNIPYAGELLVGISMPFVLIAGALITVILIGAFAGFNLLFPAVAYDGSDCFDAISRSFSYVYAKPWRMLLYTAVAAIYGSICYVFVRFFVFLMLIVTRWFLEIAIWTQNSGREFDKLSVIWPRPEFMKLLGSPVSATRIWSETTGAFLVHIFLLIVVGLLVSFIISFFFSANTIIYALMRYKVDNTAIDDIYMQFAEETEPMTQEPKPGLEEPQAQESESEPTPSPEDK